MNKSLFVIAGVALLAVPSLHAQGRGRGAGAAVHGGTATANAQSARPAAYNRGAAFNRYSAFDHGHRGGGGHRGRGRYYYLGGVPYFYPFFDYGFGYPGYYGSGFGYGYASSFASDFDGTGPGPGYYDTPYSGRYNDEAPRGDLAGGGTSLQTAVQRQLVKRGYYKGTVDGDFGEGSRAALRKFQKDSKLKDTGRLDEPTLKALGFTDRH